MAFISKAPSTRRRQKERKAERYAKDFGVKADWIRQLECVVPNCFISECDPEHVKTRGAGGTAKDLVPICRIHHTMRHASGIKTFEAQHGLDLIAEAVLYETWWQEQDPEAPDTWDLSW